MFWSGNFMVMRELNFLLKEENVTLATVLEADDILQECKADNKALIQFLTRPDILGELITLITEEPPKSVEFSQQYRQASIACEVLTSHLSTLSDRLTLDTSQMNRLCDFINKDPPLNPLLASYFSKTVEMLLERSPKQDWYLYHIVCLRVLDFFKSRRDFLPNLLRHISTSAIADTFKYLIRLDDLFNKPIMEWLEEHQFIDSLVQIICGSYAPEQSSLLPAQAPAPASAADLSEKGQRERSEKELSPADNRTNHDGIVEPAPGGVEIPAGERALRAERVAAVAAANAAALLCDLVTTGCAGEACSTRSRTAWQLAGALGSCACVRSVLCHVFTCAPRHRAQALLHGTRLLQTLLHAHTSENEEERCSVELAVAPHLPLLHQALLHDPSQYLREEEEEGRGSAGDPPPPSRRVGAARVSTAALCAQLALSEVEEVATTLLTLGTPGVLVELMFAFPENNFLHAQVVALCRNALGNRLYGTHYARHLFVECDLLTRLMDAFEDNEHKLGGVGGARTGYMGHVVQLLGWVCAHGEREGGVAEADEPVLRRWHAFRDATLRPVLLLHDTPLGGTYPSDNLYEVTEELDNISDVIGENYDFPNMAANANMDDLSDDLASDHEMRNTEEHADSAEFIAEGLGLESEDKRVTAQNSFLELANQRFDDDMWDEAPDAEAFSTAPPARDDADTAEVWAAPAWESGGSGGSGGEAAYGGEGWAHFDAFAAPPQAFAETTTDKEPFQPFWPGPAHHAESLALGLEAGLRALRLGAGTADLANNLLTAMSGMSPDAIANIVNANLQPLPLQPPQVNLPPEATAEVNTPNPVTPPAEFSNPSAQTAFPSETSASLSMEPLPADSASTNEVTSPVEVSSPAGVKSPTKGSSPTKVALPTEATVSNEVTIPTEVANETSDCSTLQSAPDSTIKVNCVSTINDIPSESKSSPTFDDSNTECKANDLSPQDKVTVLTAIDTNAIEVNDSPARDTDASER